MNTETLRAAAARNGFVFPTWDTRSRSTVSLVAATVCGKYWKSLFLAVALLWLAAPGTALALDPGYASGVLTIQGESIALTHAYAWHHKATQHKPSGWSILLTDREVPIDLLAVPETERPLQWARDQRLKGVLLHQPAKPPGQPWTVLPLLPHTAPPMQLNHLPYRLGPQGLRILGDIAMDSLDAPRPQEAFGLTVHFSAPVFRGRSANGIQ